MRWDAAIAEPRMLIGGAIAWGMVTGASAAWSLDRLAWHSIDHVGGLVLLFFLGGALAFPVGLGMARFAGWNARPETVFAAHVVALGGATVAITAGMHALYYRHYYAHWHAPAFTIVWVFQYIFTVAAALYHFAVLGMRLYLPIALPALLAFSVWQASRAR